MKAGICKLGSDRPRRLFAACRGVILAVLLAMCQRAALAECPPRYTVELVQTPLCPDPPFPPQPASGVATGIAEDGTIAGYYCQCGCKYEEAFICPPGTTIPITMNRPPGIIGARAFGVANGNLVCGTMIPSFQGMRGFLWFGFPVINLGTMPGGNWSEALAINSHFQIVGFWGNVVTGPSPQAFIFQSGMMMDLNHLLGSRSSVAIDINENGAITGWMGRSGLVNSQAFIFESNQMNVLPQVSGGFASIGRAINIHRDVVGDCVIEAPGQQYGIPHAAIWRDGQASFLPELTGTTESRATDINDTQWIVGSCTPIATTLWQGDQIWRINDLLETSLSLSIVGPLAINNAGQIAGEATVYLPNNITNELPVRLTPLPPQAGDVNCDRITNIDDLVGVITQWGPCSPRANCPADLNEDSSVNMDDLMIVILNWS